MSRSTSSVLAEARASGVPYFAKSREDASSVRSSRVRWDRIVEMRTRNGSSVAVVIFARAVSPSRRSPEGRYRRESSRRTREAVSRASAEVVKGLPCCVDGTGDEDEVAGSRVREGSIDGSGDPGHRPHVCVASKGLRDLLRREGPMALGPRGIHAQGHGPEGGRERRQVLVGEDPDHEQEPSGGEQFLESHGEGPRGGAVMGAIHEDRRPLPHDLEARGPASPRKSLLDRAVWYSDPGFAELDEGRDRETEVFGLVGTQERGPDFELSKIPADSQGLPPEVLGLPLDDDVPTYNGEGRVHLATARFDHRQGRLVDRHGARSGLDDSRFLPSDPLHAPPEVLRVLEV